MIRRLLGALVLLPGLALAQTADELDVFAAMIEAPEGTPLASATVIGGDPGQLVYVTARSVQDADGACLRVWSEGPCHPIESGQPLPGHDTLSLVTSNVPQDDMTAKFGRLQMTRQPLVAAYDAASGDGLLFLTQSALGGWERPLAPAMPSGQAAGLVVLRSDTFTPFSAGAPLMHPVSGLVGLVARAADGAASMLPIGAAVQAAQAAGVAVQDWMIPAGTDDSGLPPRVATEIGRMIIFHDYSDLGYIGGFYGPSQGTGFDADFATTIDFSVWEVDLAGGGGTRIAQGDRTVPLVPTGMGMEAPFTGRPGDHLASCIIHATPSSEGRPVFVVQFWRSVPERYNPNTDSKDYDQAAPPMTGWADSDQTCANALRDMGEERLASLANRAPAPTPTPQPRAPAPPAADEAVAGVQGDWRRVDSWTATGNEALFRDLPGGLLLTIGCTSSGELAIAISPGAGIASINGRAALASGDGSRFVLVPPQIPAEITFDQGGQTQAVPMTSDLVECG